MINLKKMKFWTSKQEISKKIQTQGVKKNIRITINWTSTQKVGSIATLKGNADSTKCCQIWPAFWSHEASTNRVATESL